MHSVFVTGSAGFFGSNLTDLLLKNGERVVGGDNFSSGQSEFLARASKHTNFKLVRGDNIDLDDLKAAMKDCDTVIHLATNADVRFGLAHPRKDLEQNTIATFNMLEAMRANSIRTIAFASTGSVYGEAQVIPTPEDAPYPIQTSLYAASKMAGEIHSYCEGFGFESDSIRKRFVRQAGNRSSPSGKVLCGRFNGCGRTHGFMREGDEEQRRVRLSVL